MHLPTQMHLYIAVLCFFTLPKCEATILTASANFTKGKAVLTSHTTIQLYSKIQCAEKCFDEGRNGRCTVAGYNKALKACYLSVDAEENVLDVADEMSGVLYMKNGKYDIHLCFDVLRIYGIYNTNR